MWNLDVVLLTALWALCWLRAMVPVLEDDLPAADWEAARFL